MVSSIDPIISGVCSDLKLERDRSLEKLKSSRLNVDENKQIETFVIEHLENEFVRQPHNTIYGVLCLSNYLLSLKNIEKISVPLKTFTQVLFCHVNDRVRLINAQTYAVLCKIYGFDYFEMHIEEILLQIRTKMNQSPSTDKELLENEEKERSNFDSYVSRNSWSVFAMTAGWNMLESHIETLKLGILNLSENIFRTYENKEIVNLVLDLTNHNSRFLREIGFNFLNSIIKTSNIFGCVDIDKELLEKLSNSIGLGISDNWSPVKMVALKCARKIFQIENVKPEILYPILLPQICINRFYVADGVRIYSQDTWALVTKGNGRQLISDVYPEALNYYLHQINANNHMIRESACCALSELFAKAKSDHLFEKLTAIINALRICLKDDSWTVRESAGTALASLIYENENLRSNYTDFIDENENPEDSFIKLLQDPIPGVRHGAANSFTKILSSFKDESMRKRCFSLFVEYFNSMHEQKAESQGFMSDRSAIQGPGVVHVIGETESHQSKYVDQPTFSVNRRLCKGNSENSDNSPYKRKSEPWEKVDGVIFLLSEFALQDKGLYEMATSEEYNFVKKIIEVCQMNHYNHYGYLLETACVTIGKICEALDKKTFKVHLDDYLYILNLGISSNQRLVISASEESFIKVANKIGKLIVKGRLEQHYDISCQMNLEKYKHIFEH